MCEKGEGMVAQMKRAAKQSHAKPSKAKPSKAKQSQAKQSQAKQNQAKPSQAKLGILATISKESRKSSGDLFQEPSPEIQL